MENYSGLAGNVIYNRKDEEARKAYQENKMADDIRKVAHSVDQCKAECDRTPSLSDRLDNEISQLEFRLRKLYEARALLTPAVEQAIKVTNLLRDLGFGRI